MQPGGGKRARQELSARNLLESQYLLERALRAHLDSTTGGRRYMGSVAATVALQFMLLCVLAVLFNCCCAHSASVATTRQSFVLHAIGPLQAGKRGYSLGPAKPEGPAMGPAGRSIPKGTGPSKGGHRTASKRAWVMGQGRRQWHSPSRLGEGGRAVRGAGYATKWSAGQKARGVGH